LLAEERLAKLESEGWQYAGFAGTWKIVYVLFGFRYCPTEKEIDEVFLKYNFVRPSYKEFLAFGALFPWEQIRYPIVHFRKFPLGEVRHLEGGMLSLIVAKQEDHRYLRLGGDYRSIWKDFPEAGCRFLAIESREELTISHVI